MAHTDKTDPFWVRMATGYYKAAAQHYHEDGVCDLVQITEWSREDGWAFTRGRCYWIFIYDGRNICACPMCHGDFHGRYGERHASRSRHQARVDVLRWRGEYNASGEIQEW